MEHAKKGYCPIIVKEYKAKIDAWGG